MSGPKSGGYAVVSPEELERRALRAAEDRFDRAATALDRVVGALQRHTPGVDRSKPVRASRSDQVNAQAAQLEALVAQLDKRLTEEQVKAAVAAIPRVYIPPRAESEVNTTQPGSSAITQSGKQVTVQKSVAQAVSMVEQMVAIIGRPPGPDVARALESVALSQTRDQCRLTLGDLRLKVQRTIDAHQQAQRNDACKAEVLREIDGCTGIEAVRLRQAVEAIPPGGPVPVTVAHAREVAQRDHHAADEVFVQDAVVDVLRDIGFQVDSPAGVTVARDGVLLALFGYPDHVARIRAADGQLQFNVVRVGAATSSATTQQSVTDAQAEVAACEVFAEVREGLVKSGVVLNLHRHDQPGQTPVARSGQRPAAAKRRDKRAKRRPAAQQKSRTADE